MTEDIRRTLLFLLKDGHILLSKKKHGFGEGYYVGAGGKLHLGETIEQALIREAEEEIGITPLAYQKVAELDFIENADTEPWHMYVHTYIASEWQGEPIESEEMLPQWFRLEDIPYHSMWEDARQWLPLVLAGEHVKGSFTFDQDNKLIEHTITTTTEWRQ